MNKENEIEEMIYEIFAHTDFHGREYEAKHIAQALANAGIGDKKQAVKEFAEKLKEVAIDISKDVGIECSVLRTQTLLEQIDNLITELYGADE